jgi:hypothetical protein
VSRWPVAGPSEYWLLASSPASKVVQQYAHMFRATNSSVLGSLLTVYTVKNCFWGRTNLSFETYRADLKRLINEKCVASCWVAYVVVLVMHGHTNIKLSWAVWSCQVGGTVWFFEALGTITVTKQRNLPEQMSCHLFICCFLKWRNLLRLLENVMWKLARM